MHNDKNYYEIVLTGASSAGKTTALSFLAQKLADRGFHVLRCPEVASLLLDAGTREIPMRQKEEPEMFYHLEKSMLLMQMEMRSHFRRLAQAYAPQPTVILYDRGEMDVLAYAGRDLFHRILGEEELSLPQLRDHYDAVVHLVSVAVDFPELYSSENNPARWETVEQARSSNSLIMQAWTGTPHLWVIDNQDRMEGKLEKTLQAVLHTVGFPAPVEHEYKFLLENEPPLSELESLGAARIEIQQTYLLANQEGEFRVRQRSQDGGHTFYYTRKQDLPGGGRAEYEAQITLAEYERLLGEADPEKPTLQKTRWCFVWEHTYYELDHFVGPDGDLWLLEVETMDSSNTPRIPDWLGPVKDVTHNHNYRSASIAQQFPSPK